LWERAEFRKRKSVLSIFEFFCWNCHWIVNGKAKRGEERSGIWKTGCSCKKFVQNGKREKSMRNWTTWLENHKMFGKRRPYEKIKLAAKNCIEFCKRETLQQVELHYQVLVIWREKIWPPTWLSYGEELEKIRIPPTQSSSTETMEEERLQKLHKLSTKDLKNEQNCDPLHNPGRPYRKKRERKPLMQFSYKKIVRRENKKTCNPLCDFHTNDYKKRDYNALCDPCLKR